MKSNESNTEMKTFINLMCSKDNYLNTLYVRSATNPNEHICKEVDDSELVEAIANGSVWQPIQNQFTRQRNTTK